MQRKQSRLPSCQLDDPDEGRSVNPTDEALQIRARGLARLLIYATQDALDLGGNDIAATLVDVAEQIIADFQLADPGICPGETETLH